MKKILTPLLAVVFLTGIGLVIYGGNHVPHPTFHGKLADVLPLPPEGWTLVRREIVNTPEMKEAVGEILNYDDGVFVDYINGKDHLSVYIAYWKPGKMSHRLVAVHTPDVCWVGNGWKKERSEIVTGLISADGKKIAPAEGRLFTMNGQPEYVWFWHFVGGEAKSYASGYVPPWYAPFKDLVGKGLQQRQEQFFIRISSDEPLDSKNIQAVLRLLLVQLPFPSPQKNN